MDIEEILQVLQQYLDAKGLNVSAEEVLQMLSGGGQAPPPQGQPPGQPPMQMPQGEAGVNSKIVQMLQNG